ncbi:kinase-like domain-containing protein [Boletus coccyginus]|nr:kinase-like domain-containing protein [Boletus coccyginus]
MCDTVSLVSLWMPNGTLQEFLEEHDSTLDVLHRLRLLLDIAEGLHYLHSFPVIHGDLNSNNILLDADNTACLTDFGYASLVGDIPEALDYLQWSTAQPGAMLWAAPEDVLPGNTFGRTTKSDIYSFGCIGLQVLSGKQPWSEVQPRTVVSIALLLAQGQKPRRPDSHAIADQHWDLIQQCWLSAQERPSTDSIITTIEMFLRTNRTEYDYDTKTSQGPYQASEEPPATLDIEDLEIDDIVIAVMGPGGSGKSTFVRLASGRSTQGVGHTLRSFTSHVAAIRYWDQDSGRHVVLVDTPGFDVTFKSDLEILDMISNWLNLSYKQQKLLSGIVYLHRITDNRMVGTPLKNLGVLRKLCGRDTLEKVHLTTTMWDEVNQSVGEGRLEALRRDYWKALIDLGAHIDCCRSDDDSAKNIIRQILDKEASHKALLLQEEMVDLKKELRGTGAGQELYFQLEKLVEKQMALLRRIDKETMAASDAGLLAALQTEYNELRIEIDDKLRQMQDLKLSRLRKLLRLFSRRRS